jgi:ubiquinone biosynthesis protein COQ4
MLSGNKAWVSIGCKGLAVWGGNAMRGSDTGDTVEEIPPEKIEWINGFATPPSPPINPFHALASVYRLVRNKEDTRQVFEIIQSLSGRSGKQLFKRFTATPYGRQVVTEPVKLEEILSDHEKLRALPGDSVGRAYLDFMEGENLTPEGLLEAAKDAGIDLEAYPEIKEYMRAFKHLEISHDLWHVLTGYGRDALGELCNLGFTRAQTGNSGIRLITFIGGLAAKSEKSDQPFWRAISEGERIGRDAEWLLEHDVEELLPLPLAEARRRLNIAEPVIYNAIPEDIKETLLKPKVELTQAERERTRAQNAPT